MVRYLALCFLVICSLPAQARFISQGDYGRLKAGLHSMESSLARAHRAVDDRTPDELRFALKDIRNNLLEAAVLYKKFRRNIDATLEATYQQNAAYGYPQMWPDSEAKKLDRYRAEAADITSAEKMGEFALKSVEDALQRLAVAREAGFNPLDQTADMYRTSVGDIEDDLTHYRELLIHLGDY